MFRDGTEENNGGIISLTLVTAFLDRHLQRKTIHSAVLSIILELSVINK